MHFKKAFITYYHCAKIQVSVFNSLWEEGNGKVFGPSFALIMAPYDLWPCKKKSNWAFLKSPYHMLPLCKLSSFCVQWCLRKVQSKSFGAFLHLLWPLITLTFASGNQSMLFWKDFITYYHPAKFQGSVIYSLWEKLNIKVFVPSCQCQRRTIRNAVHQYIDSPCFTSSSKRFMYYIYFCLYH